MPNKNIVFKKLFCYFIIKAIVFAIIAPKGSKAEEALLKRGYPVIQKEVPDWIKER